MDTWEYEENESNTGCLSGFALPLLGVLFGGLCLVLLAILSPAAPVVSASAASGDLHLPAAVGSPPTETAPLPMAAATPITPLFEIALATQPPAATPIPPLPVYVPANDNGTAIAPLFTPEVRYWSREIQAWAAEAGMDPNLLATLMQIESCGNPQARSKAEALGLFQVMPYHFFATDNPYDPETNALRAMAYLYRSQEAARGDIRLTLAGYNGGLGMIGQAETAWPEETQRYVHWGSGIYQDAINNSNESQRLLEWLAAGGDSLCKLARPRLGMGD
jgi:soluble lytic murein transglycosylase-like protein